jgi:hypothetical protein
VVLIVGANVAQLHGAHLDCCRSLVAYQHGQVAPIKVAALAFGVGAIASALRIRLRRPRRPAVHDDQEVQVLESDQPVAYALPGKPGQIVISTSMLHALDRQERRVLLAHERSHLRRHHHRYIRATEFAVAVMPFLHPLNARLRFTIERWADEDAAQEVGDRALVASAIARAALAAHEGPQLALAIADASVVERVEIMLADTPSDARMVESLFSGVALAGGMGLATSLLFVGHLCCVTLVGTWR